jgi:4-aminobutyrate aminotransferase-like enzyme
MRELGALCISDEVQVGFGRVGECFWGFELHGVVPDIVTMGKPIGNGHPIGAVVTTREIAEAFDNGMEYFNTFGGNPVSCAIGEAVLDVIEAEELQAHAAAVGSALLAGLRELQARHELIGDVRGLGLFVGVELVLDRTTLAPAPGHAAYIANRMRDHGIFISTDGPLHNVLKLKPPLPFSHADAERVIATLDRILQETPANYQLTIAD